MKPYRLINASELCDLNQKMKQIIQQWNDNYCVTPLSMALVLPPKKYSITHATLVHQNNKPLAFCESNYLSVMQQALFGTEHTCFNSASHDLVLILFNSLFNTKQCQMNQKIEKKFEWFYPGSTCLLLTLSCAPESELATHFSLILNPDWVYQHLPKINTDKKMIHCLDDALAEHRLKLNVELLPSTLTLNTLTELNVGDVLSTDHLLSTPLRLTRETELLAEADLGQSAEHKSIILKRPI